MRPRLQLDLVRTFAVAARSHTFAEAASRLNLTPSAVSHQMRSLELQLGTRLFKRQGRSARLNAAGVDFLRSIEPALHSIDGAAAKLSDHDATRGPLLIASSAMFANCFLSHCLPQFIEAFPGIECRVSSMQNSAVASDTSADIGILFGDGRWRGRWSWSLGAVRYAPVCSPRLLAGADLNEPDVERLLRHVIVHIDDGEEWRRWHAAAGMTSRWPPERQLFTNDVSFALTIAASGGGVTLASDLLAAAHLRSGTLIRPFGTSIEVDGAWHVTAERNKIIVPRVQLFTRWLAERVRLPPPEFE